MRHGVPKIAKNGANAPGRLDLFIFIEKRPGYVANAPERYFSRFSRGRLRGASPRHEKVCEKDIFFHIYSSIQVCFFTFVSRLVNSTRPDQHFFYFWKRPGGGCLLPYFRSEKRPGGAVSVLFMERPWGRLLRSLRYTWYVTVPIKCAQSSLIGRNSES